MMSSSSSPTLSLGTVESIGSDVESLVSIDGPEIIHIPEDINGSKLFTLGDGDFNISVNGTMIQTHKYLLKRFNVLKQLIQQKGASHESGGLHLEQSPSDFLNTLKVLYTSPIEATPDFDPGTLVSALRIATAYDYPALRTFTITRLENAQLKAIERIQIAREFRLTSWKIPAYEELCARDEPITKDEATILGIDAFVHVAKIREREQRRRGQTDAYQEHETIGLPNSTGVDERATVPVATQVAISESQARDLKLESKSKIKRKGRKIPTSAKGVPVIEPIPDQSREIADAFEQLQSSQLAHSASIARLSSALEDIRASLTSPDPAEDDIEFTSVQNEIREWLATSG
ncbi:hypothetical protein RhiJN_01089 [Ceratobasidium sp. AG-Ba]|nr:hypothetical protein RhiJN_01089 [Ceratobasidium sp. AG-Ba]QRW02121.1 hypothetical protein RhiLY_01118 [Ceratobasidium sp. AG-Ba]